ncbi:hypothetical protein X801_01018 [Opisthorchis viverrini]|uniref:Uncharacterized protein n=1 Tax=Opisthorchis viverrini TaxID=6198 RepID=A0A1S8X8M8_OPIVI|nr:hypothetical protein X801_01018 [Opisthorchis viverrini]
MSDDAFDDFTQQLPTLGISKCQTKSSGEILNTFIRKSVEEDLPASEHTELAATPMSCIQKLDELKKEMQELVAKEDTLRNQLRSYNKDTAELSQSQLKRQVEKIVNELHDRLSQTAKYTVIHKRVKRKNEHNY